MMISSSAKFAFLHNGTGFPLDICAAFRKALSTTAKIDAWSVDLRARVSRYRIAMTILNSMNSFMRGSGLLEQNVKR